MEESVVADFVGRVHTSGLGSGEPVTGRVLLLSQRRRRRACHRRHEDDCPLSKVFDIVVGTVPGDLLRFFSDSVTVAYEQGGDRVYGPRRG